MKILVTGVSGYLGSALYDFFRDRYETTGTYYRNPVANCKQLDISHRQAVHDLLIEEQPQLAIHCSGLIDECDIDPNKAYEVNIQGIHHLVTELADTDARLVFISSAAVFDASPGKFSENHPVSAVSEYGKLKIAAEERVKSSNRPHLIIRPSLIVGKARYGEHKFYNRTLKKLLSGQKLQLDDTWKFSPTGVHHVAQVIEWWLTAKKECSILHVASEGITSKFQLFMDLSRELDLETTSLISPASGLLSKKTAEREPFNSETEKQTPLTLLDVITLKELHAPYYSYTDLIKNLAGEVQINFA